MLVLASASPRRSELLAAAGYTFSVEPAGADETLPRRAPPEEAAREIARRKAAAIACPAGSVVLAADTLVVAADGEILGKPRDAADARRMLRKLSGTTHRVITGVAVRTASGTVLDAVTTHVTMREISAADVDAYVASGESFDKAGAYAIQETGDRFVVRTDGSFTNVVGLPMERTRALLAAADVKPRRRFLPRIHATTLAALVVVAGGVLAFAMRGPSKPTAAPPGHVYVALAPGTPRALEVLAEIAADPVARQRGLGGRRSLPKDGGMLFVYPAAEPRNFWMKDCYLALDIAFIGADRRILNVVTLRSGAELPEQAIPRGESSGPARYVLEMAAGWFSAHGIKAGDAAVPRDDVDRLATH